LGIRGIVEKPFDAASLLAEMVNVIQQYRYPTEQLAMDRRIIHNLMSGNRSEASRLIAAYLSNSSFDDAGKNHMEAEYAFHEGNYHQCVKFCMDALKLSGDSVILLNLLGKALMKLGQYESALKILEKANSLAPKNIERICSLASICTDMKKMPEAEKYLVEAKSIDATSILVQETEASMAISTEDTKRASKVLQDLENLHRIVAYTNNKAVAKIRNGQFHEGISLYRTALESLPAPWSLIHETIGFNLCLALVRNSQYPDALDLLGRFKSESSSTMGIKVASMRSKLEQAIRTKTQLHFAPESQIEASRAEGEPINLSQLIDSMVPVRGDMCCYRIFQAQNLASDASRKLLNNMPRLLRRPPIRR
jgi:tetratricopeptide (TPR) repeat protein